MNTTTLERASHMGVDERQESPSSIKAVDVIESLLHRAEELPDAEMAKLSDEEVNRQFAMLVTGATELDLHRYAGQGQIEEYRDTVRGADELLDRIHQTAKEVLTRNNDLTNEESTLTVNYLGLAADLTRDKGILNKTLDAMNETQDYSLVTLKRALEFARDRDMTFYVAYRDIKNGKHALSSAATNIPMSQRPDFEDSDPLAKWLSKREVEMPRHHNWEQVKEALGFRALYQAMVSRFS